LSCSVPVLGITILAKCQSTKSNAKAFIYKACRAAKFYRVFSAHKSSRLHTIFSLQNAKLLPHMNPDDLQRLVTLAMPYGKYKGRLIADLPGHYLNWFAREGFPKGDLGRLLQLMQEIDHNGLSSLLEPLRNKAR